jgi:transposase
LTMLSISGDAKIYVCLKAVDLRKGFDLLAAIAEELFPKKLLSYGYFVFFNKSKDRMKVLYWDVDGFAIWYKRLEKGSFSKKIDQECLDRKAFLMLLEGVTPQKIQRRFSLEKG